MNPGSGWNHQILYDCTPWLPYQRDYLFWPKMRLLAFFSSIYRKLRGFLTKVYSEVFRKMLSSDAIESDDRISECTKLWGGRFEGTGKECRTIGASIFPFDHQLAKFDLMFPAHIQMRNRPAFELEEAEQIHILPESFARFRGRRVSFWYGNKDELHMNMEVRLLRKSVLWLGNRHHYRLLPNDQVATDMVIHI